MPVLGRGGSSPPPDTTHKGSPPHWSPSKGREPFMFPNLGPSAKQGYRQNTTQLSCPESNQLPKTTRSRHNCVRLSASASASASASGSNSAFPKLTMLWTKFGPIPCFQAPALMLGGLFLFRVHGVCTCTRTLFAPSSARGTTPRYLDHNKARGFHVTRRVVEDSSSIRKVNQC